MQKEFDRLIEGFLPEKGRILLGVSGGMDSICMAELFLNSSVPVSFELAHCNFRLRGEESDGDEDFVKKWCLDKGVVINNVSFDTEQYASSKSLSIEMAARELRYSYFASLCREKGFDAVAVAHNADDNAETLILNLLRGTGLRGLCGMKTLSSLDIDSLGLKARLPSDTAAIALKLRIFRPLLAFSRKDIAEYIDIHNIAYREDSTNTLTEYRRNKIRNLVFPIFGEINPSFVRTINSNMRRFSQAELLLDEYYEDARAGLIQKESEGQIRFSIASLMEKKHWKYILFRILDEYSFNEDTLNSLSAMLDSGDSFAGRVFSSHNYELLTASDSIIIYKSLKGSSKNGCMPVREGRDSQKKASGKKIALGFDSIYEGEQCLVVEGCGFYEFKGKKYRVDKHKWEKGSSPIQPDGVLAWDADKMPLPVLLRGWEAGDWMRPIGVKGRKKLSDIFTDLKYSLLDKEKAVVVISPNLDKALHRSAAFPGTRVAALLCIRLDEEVKITESTKFIYRISLCQDS